MKTKYGTHSTQAQRDAAVAFAKAAMEPITLCDKVGVASGRLFLCRYRAGHGGRHYFEAHGAVEVPPMNERPDPPCITDPSQHEWHWSEYTHRHVCVECGYVATLEEEAADAATVDLSISVPDGEVY